MPKAPRKKYYAVKIGREGPRIYETWDEVSRHPGAIHKSFTSRIAAEQWLAPALSRLGSSSQETGDSNDPELTSQDGESVYEDACQSLTGTPGPSSQPMEVSESNVPKDTVLPTASLEPPATADPVPEPEPEEIVLSSEQKAILELVKSGRNVFFTGSAGTGKSVLLRAIIQALKKHRHPETFAITASTGIASINIGGTTLHSWAGIGLGQEDATKLAKKIVGQRVKPGDNSWTRWRRTKTLIVDEISMIDGTLFQKLLILSGDFCQLPPVPDRRRGEERLATFAFDSEAWKRCMGKPITLTQVFRQKDKEFVGMLNGMRFGQLSPETITRFRGLARPVTYDDGIEPTELYPTRREVELANHDRLDRIQEQPHNYTALDQRGYDYNHKLISFEQMNRLLERLVAPKKITLKVGAQVMLIKNLVQGSLVNGSQGKVIGFYTFAEAEVNDTEIAKTIEGDEDTKDLPDAIKRSMLTWPLVQFTNGRQLLCSPKEFTVDNAHGEKEASRHQVPLILAWALSIHKSQGQTIERVKVDLRRTFEKGQAYVALSRATNMDTLQVIDFDPMKVVAHPRVLQWHRELTEGESFDDYDEMDTDLAAESYYAE
ncbi:hypothetical protein EVG20_g7185 [Dentipellis fragilis]|uniref:ATP-dependent DNA helicase PIF1 n=1 Tax=Dentipellis fragilis TaxID=205917 RepID=A0A4Y9YGX5_9AGAM|nr:hypothetical protein EVG20_g7185 [Dentipellis fragilis]